jgi:tetratricopeptide (TPR) repeat protein
VEARYRAATSFERAGKKARARELYDDLASEPASDRQARAAFARAKLELEAGNRDAGLALLDAAIRRFPASGVARRNLERRLLDLETESGPEAALDYLEQVESPLADTELAEAVGYQKARYLERAGDLDAARDAYLDVAERFPYPYGAYWDDALYHSAEIDVELGRPSEAVSHLERMLSKREPAPMHGSLERPRFGPARFLMAEVYRDELRDLRAARRNFLLIVTEHPTSPLRDDALWEAALIAHRVGDTSTACRDLHRLVKGMPDSRYAPCAPRVCRQLPRSESRCKGYIAERIPESN